MPQPSGCVDSIQKSLKEFLRGAVSEFLPWASIQLVSSGEDILVGEALDRSSLWDKGPEQAIVSLVLRTLPGGVRVGEENLAAPVLHLGEVSEPAAVVHSNGFKDLREVFSVLIMEGVHEIHHRLTGFARDTERKVGFRLLLQQGKDNSLLTRSLADHGIAFPVALFKTKRCNLRAAGNACAVALFVLSHAMLLRFAL